MKKEEDKINSFTFYRDYFNLIDTLPIDDKKELAVAIIDYIFEDKKPKLVGHNLAIFNTLSHQLDVSKGRRNNAKIKKSKQNQKEIKSKSNENQKEIKLNSNEVSKQNQKGYKNSISNFNILNNFNIYISNFKDIINNSNLSNNLKNEIEVWLKYKFERKEVYKEIGFKSLVSQIEKKTKEFGEEKIIDVIELSMASNWKGIFFDKLEKVEEKKKELKKSNDRNEEIFRNFLEKGEE